MKNSGSKIPNFCFYICREKTGSISAKQKSPKSPKDKAKNNDSKESDNRKDARNKKKFRNKGKTKRNGEQQKEVGRRKV